jgi:hypothetical protein
MDVRWQGTEHSSQQADRQPWLAAMGRAFKALVQGRRTVVT